MNRAFLREEKLWAARTTKPTDDSQNFLQSDNLWIPEELVDRVSTLGFAMDLHKVEEHFEYDFQKQLHASIINKQLVLLQTCEIAKHVAEWNDAVAVDVYLQRTQTLHL